MSVACRWSRQLCVHSLSLHRGVCSSALLSKNEGSVQKKVWFTPELKRKRESWNAPDEPVDVRNQVPTGEWRGALHQFVTGKPSNVDLISYMQRGVDLRPSAVKKWWSSIKTEAASNDQTFKPERVAMLGFDLAAAHFVVHRGGKVRFKDAQEWVQQDEDGVYELVRQYQPGVFVEEVDASGINLVYEGLESIKNLQHITSLSVAGCPHIDDWCIDRICSQFSGTLEHLDLSGCTAVTQHGMGALVRMRNLRTLNLQGLDGVKNIELLCLLLRDNLMELKISGIDYLKP